MPPMSATYSAEQPLRVAVLISGGGTTLENFILRLADGRMRRLAIAGVISSRGDVRGVEIARAAALPLTIVRKRDHAGLYEYSEALVRALDAARAELVVMAGFLCLWRIPPRYEGRVLNIHPALLPKYGGQGMYGHHVHEAVLAAGERESGCTVHLADNEYDHGATLGQARVPVLPDDTAEALAARVGVAERELYPRVLQEVADGGLERLARLRASPLVL
jgi:phosphoribosylglycinamide formyltransferase 1